MVSIPLSSGKDEVLVTNLTDKDESNLDDLKALYHLRWGVEESYKLFKKTLHIEHFTGKSPQAIYQDFNARVFMLNMASIIRTQAIDSVIKNVKGHHKMKANKTQVLAKTKDFLIDLFFSNRAYEVITQMIRMLKSRLEITRPNRPFDRKGSCSRRRSKIINYKGI